jgi:DNA (cytosine-5)-methyltransferase 1
MAMRVMHHTDGKFASKGNVLNQACPTITNRYANLSVQMDGRPEPPRAAAAGKPPYRVPSMAEVAAVSWNGFTVASTFSGCGGSCLGYRMAGFKVIWANEFVPAAQDSYRANMSAGCVLDPRDIRLVQPEEILRATGLVRGELDLFDGSPPCQAFSTAGKREKGWGQKKRYEHGAEQCNETLFDEYIRLLRGLQPKTFIAENVSGLIKGTAKGWFIEVLRALKTSGYRVKARLLDAQWLGVPQMRQRIIFIGVREDLGCDPVHPQPLRYRYSVRDALSWIMRGKYDDTWRAASLPSPTVSASLAYNAATSKQGLELVEAEIDMSGYATGTAERRKFTIAELRRICAFPDDFVLTGTYAQQWERLGNSVPPLMMKAIAETVRDKVLCQ